MKFGPYNILKRLKPRGAGFVGDVHLARDTRNNRLIALKLIERGHDDVAREALKAEENGAKIQKALAEKHPNVPKVWEYGEKGRFFFIAMEYVEGEDLSSVMRRQRLSYPCVMKIASGVCSTLEAAHRLTTDLDGKKIDKIFHGDIKPQNIRLTPDGGVKLLDFGIAKGTSLTRNMTYNAFGTLEYCSPERVERRRLDEHADLWSVGVLLYEMVCGRRPFQAEEEHELLQRFRTRQPPDPLPADCPLLLGKLIESALSFDMAQRPQTAAEISNYLRAHDEKQTAHLKGGGTGPVKDDEEWDDIIIEDPNMRGLAGAAPRRSFRRGVGIGLACAALVIAVLLYLEYRAYQRRSLLHEQVSAASVIRLADVEPLWARYQSEARGGFLGFGMEPLRAGITQKLNAVAERVIRESVGEQHDLLRSHWDEAKTCLTRILDIGGADPMVKAMLHYCEGQLERIDGAAMRGEGRREEASRKYQSAIRHFRDAAALQPQWPHPHLALSVIYTYYEFDVRAGHELDTAKTLGLNNLGRRETALRADWLRIQADRLLEEVSRRRTNSAGDYQQILGFYEQSLEKYRQIPNFTTFTPGHIAHVDRQINLLRQRIQVLNSKAAVTPAKKKMGERS